MTGDEPAPRLPQLNTKSEGSAMNIERWTDRRPYRLATWALVLATVTLWWPLSWERDPNPPGTHLHVDFGVLKPLRATWQSSADGFWFAFSDVRGVALVLTAVLTAATLIAARETSHRYGKTRQAGFHEDTDPATGGRGGPAPPAGRPDTDHRWPEVKS
jgi:hypothetical protein